MRPELKHSQPSTQPHPAHPERDFLSRLVAVGHSCRSWREKLDGLRGILADDTVLLKVEDLVDTAVFLRFLGTGEIPCVEDGRHFRPVHHARIASQIQDRLARLTTPETAFVLRKIYPCLPSFAQPFQRAEPLTRIRDIAHRNDIPSDLKREIKHTLQNKLHRCAGPEDLMTSSALLERITAPDAAYPRAFVEQFEIFHRELSEFFNARTVEEQLKTLLPKIDAVDATLIRAFLTAKDEPGIGRQLDAFRALTQLRRRLLEAAQEPSNADAHEFLLADIGLEDFAFRLLSEMVNALDDEPAGLSGEPFLETLSLAIINLSLSDIDPEECRAVEAELRVWRSELNLSDRECLLRLKATLDRSRRLAEDCSDRIIRIFTRRASAVGRAFGVAERMIQVFSDAEIRSHVIFQISKLVSIGLRHLRRLLSLPDWDVLVCGRVKGRLRLVDTLVELGRDLPEPVVALLRRAEGDEEIPNAVTGILLAHDLPHLSHLGVRARQRGVVFAACEEPAMFAELEGGVGQIRELIATPEAVTCRGTSCVAPVERQRSVTEVPAVELQPKRPWIPLDQVSVETCGAKAEGARRLVELSQQEGAGFRALPGVVVPFGVMEIALHAAPDLEAEYDRILRRLHELAPVQLAVATARLRDIIAQLQVPKEIGDKVANMFGDAHPLMVRSSANCEDLERMAGAGLYESVANVAPAKVASAVRRVWASLWSESAVLSRRQSGVPHERAHMAVLIQPMVAPDISFVLHTVNPIHLDSRQAYAELAVGLGETLASGATRGCPYRFICDKASGELSVVAFANFSHAVRPNPGGGLRKERLNYSVIAFSRDRDARRQVARSLAGIARRVERAFKQAQDIEGFMVDKEVCLVQARPQQGTHGKVL